MQHNFFGASKLLSLRWFLAYSMAKGFSVLWVCLVRLILVGSGEAAHWESVIHMPTEKVDQAKENLEGETRTTNSSSSAWNSESDFSLVGGA